MKRNIAIIKRYISVLENKFKKEIKTEDYFIAYFDILGYKKIVSEGIINEKQFIGIIQEILQKVNKVINLKKQTKCEFKFYCFSDNFLICIKCNNSEYAKQIHSLTSLIWIMQILQCSMISLNKIFIRGSIVKGKLYCDKNFVYGEGLINAYTLENNIAVYPRILIQKEIIDEAIIKCNNVLITLKRDSEKIRCDNVFNCYANAICDLFKKYGVIDNETYEIWYDECKHIKIIEDFDGNYFIDYLEYLNYEDNLTAINIKGKKQTKAFLIKSKYIAALEFNWRKFSDNFSVSKKLLWTCNYANNFFQNNGDEKIINKSRLLAKSCVDLEEINKSLLMAYKNGDNTQLGKRHLEYLIKIIENL